MIEPKEKKKKSPVNVEAQRISTSSVGETLRTAREQKNVSYEEISAVIHVRAGQLKAIEEGNISALPGMTYALGFVKSYAAYLKLNAPEIVQKFKAEHGNTQAPGPLHYPEVIVAGRQPNWFVIGIGALCVAVLLTAWMIFSASGDKAAKTAEAIPSAPAVGTVTGITPKAETQPAVNTPAAAPAPTPAPAPVAATPAPTPAPQVAVAAPADQEAIPAPAPVQPKPAPTIKITRGKGRVMLSAQQSSWVEIKDADGNRILQKVLRPGEEYYVPNQPGLKLITSNAGGFDVFVDGEQVSPLGAPGDILRGVSLEPDDLKKVRAHVRNGH